MPPPKKTLAETKAELRQRLMGALKLTKQEAQPIVSAAMPQEAKPIVSAAMLQDTTVADAAFAARWKARQEALAAEAKRKLEEANKKPAAPVVPHLKQQQDGKWIMVGYENDLRAMARAVPELQQRLLGGIKAEQDAGEKVFMDIYGSGNVRQLQNEGAVLLALRAETQGVLYRSRVWRFSTAPEKGKSSGLPYNRFKQGDSVIVAPYTPSRKGSSVSADDDGVGQPERKISAQASQLMDACVLEVKKGHLLITLDDGASDRLEEACLDKGSGVNEVKKGHVLVILDDGASDRLVEACLDKGALWRIDQSFRDPTSERRVEAVERLNSFTDPRSPTEVLVRCVIVGSPNSKIIAAQRPLWVQDADWCEDIRAALKGHPNLNNSQRRAAANAVVRTFTLWQGPPGTGKTRTLLALVGVLVQTASRSAARWKEMGTILACGDTNAAVDNLVEGLHKQGLRVVRVGQPAKWTTLSRDCTNKGFEWFELGSQPRGYKKGGSSGVAAREYLTLDTVAEDTKNHP
eukprot:gene563-1973_t